LRLSDFDYRLPEELIAQRPPEQRDAARMLVVDRAAGTWRDAHFREFPAFLGAGDCVVVNDSRVFPSRLLGMLEPGGGRAEIFLLRRIAPDTWLALAKPGKRLGVGARVRIDADLLGEVLSRGERGERVVRFTGAENLMARLEAAGHIPLPPYIRRGDDREDRERYQTVFAREQGSAAAPTAGLHFNDAMLDRVRATGAELAAVTLHVGLGTFQPIENATVEANHLHAEQYSVEPEAWAAITAAKRAVVIGTTSVRAIETASRTGRLSGETDIFLYPGQRFERTGALLTNFHLPQSSLLLLVCAFGGTDLVLAAYRHAVEQRYRFFSYGDCMLLV
jgi:S-adenosylmethionine:tRNA ribosyltransferase-isomerase